MKEALQWTTSLIEVNGLHYSTQVYQIDQTMGSILRPLLFLIFINSFPQHLEANQIRELFANDTTILFSTNQGDNREEQTNHIIQASINSCKDLNLKTKMTKTINMNFKIRNNTELT